MTLTAGRPGPETGRETVADGDRRPSTQGAVLELEQVSKTYPGATPVTALHDVSLTVMGGEIVALVGSSGSGKSTLLNVMSTLDRPTSGRVRIAGSDVTNLTDAARAAIRAHHLGFIFQSFHLLDSICVRENVAMGSLYRGQSRRERLHAADAALRQVGLAHRSGHRPPQLSGGERQRVAIARALMAEPSIILADEPTGNLDSVTSAEIMALLLDLNASGVTILVITHDRDLAAHLPRHVTLRDGRIVADTTRHGGERHARVG